MKVYSFDDYWKNHGKYHYEIVANPKELEEDFYNLCKKIWYEATGTKEEIYEIGHLEGWDACKDKVVSILNKVDMIEDRIKEIKNL
jgi:hypothetical protein